MNGRIYLIVAKVMSALQQYDYMKMYFDKAASDGNLEAKYRIAILHWNGKHGLKKDERLGFTMLRHTAHFGYKKAIKLVYKCYRDGKFGIKRDPDKAEQWRLKMLEV